MLIRLAINEDIALITITTINNTTAVAYAWFMCNPSEDNKYIWTANVLPEENNPSEIAVTVPAVYISAAVSPTILPTASIIPDKIPGIADGSTILNTVLNLPAPSPKLPSL